MISSLRIDLDGRMDSGRVDTTKAFWEEFDSPLPRNDPTYHFRYFTSGFIFLQDLIEQTVIRRQTGRQHLPAMSMQQLPTTCYVLDVFFEAISKLLPFFMILSFAHSSAMMVKSIVHEKERRLKETMRTMGLGNGVHWVAWFIDSISVLFVISILLTMVLTVSGPSPYYSIQ